MTENLWGKFPWRVEHSENWNGNPMVVDANGRPIAAARDVNMDPHYGPGLPLREVDAQLIACLPVLLDFVDAVAKEPLGHVSAQVLEAWIALESALQAVDEVVQRQEGGEGEECTVPSSGDD